MCGTAQIFLADLQASEITIPDEPAEVIDVNIHSSVLTSQQVLAASHPAQPIVQFATNYLDGHDVSTVNELQSGTIHTRLRVRGAGQDVSRS